MNEQDYDICVVGLGYVGLPLALSFAKAGKKVLGFDVNSKKIDELKSGHDRTREADQADLGNPNIEYSDDPSLMKKAPFIIVAVPTPIDAAKRPDLTLVESASKLVGQNLSEGSIVVFESTVYPGVTEEVCVPIIDQESGFACGKRWYVGYSPERINPGDKEHTLEKIVKVVAGMTPEITDKIAATYEIVCKAGVHKAETIMVAEAAKVIENIQRDINIALMNELSLIFNKLGIRTKDVLRAAGTKWNFHGYQPGLVGGHCIGVDPYYLVHRALEAGIDPQIISSGRAINDGMPAHVATQTIQALVANGKDVPESRALVLGVTFKENVPDIRNSKTFEVIEQLRQLGLHCDAYDPVADAIEISHEYEFGGMVTNLERTYDAVIIAVPHAEIVEMGLDSILGLLNDNGVIFDIKSRFHPNDFEETGVTYFSL